jgi:outer membrane protein assembly factor BamB
VKSLASAAIHVQAGSPSSSFRGHRSNCRSRRLLTRLLALAAGGTLVAVLMPAAAIAAPSQSALAAPAQPHVVASGDWTQFRNGATHEGYNAAETILSASTVPHLALAWKGAVNPNDPDPDYRVMDSSPAVANGVVYVGSRNSGKLFAYAVGCGTDGATCTPLWTASTDNWWIGSSPAVYTNGSSSQVFITGTNGHLYAFDAHGNTNCGGNPKTCTPLWTASIGGGNNVVSPTVYNGVVYVASSTGFVYAFDPTTCGTGGTPCVPLWTSAATGSVFHSSPAVAVVTGGAHDGQPLVYIGADDGNLYVYSATGTTGCSSGTCSPLWISTASGATLSSPAVANSLVYVGSGDGRMRAFDAKGSVNCVAGTCVAIWTVGTGGASIDSSAAVVNAVAYYGIGSNLQALDLSPAGGWHAVTGAHVNSSPAVANGVVYVGSQDGKLYAYAVGCNTGDGACSPIWTYTTGGVIHSSPAVANGVVYVGSDDGYLYAFDLPVDHLALSPADATAAAGVHQAYTAEGFDAYGDSLGDVTPFTAFTTSGFGSCAGASCWSTTPGTVWVSGSDGNAHGMAFLHVTPAAATHLTVSDLPSPYVAGVAHSVTVRALDAYGNTATGYRGKVHFTSSDPAAVRPADYSFTAPDAGVHIFSVTLKTAGTQSVTATDMATASIKGSQTGIVVRPVPSTYHPITPVRLLDTRSGNGHSGKLVASTPITFAITGRGGIPANAVAVTGNVTVVNSTAAWAVYLGPAPVAAPTASTINFVAGQVTGNGLTVALSSTGTLSATYMGPAGAGTDLVFDVTGFYTPDASGDTYHPITPVRELDTRTGNGLSAKLEANTPACFGVAGRNGVPTPAKAVTGNVTAVGPSAAWAVYLGPASTSAPTTSAVNFTAGAVAGNNVTVALNSSGQLCTTYMGPAGATTDLVFDVTGYYTADASGASFVPLTPVRLLDTRSANGLTGTFSANTPRTFGVASRGGVPADATAVTGNLTVVNETNAWAVYLGPAPVAKPTTSTLNFALGDIKGNGLTVALSATGTLSATYMSTAGNTTDLVFDVTGYFVPSPL